MFCNYHRQYLKELNQLRMLKSSLQRKVPWLCQTGARSWRPAGAIEPLVHVFASGSYYLGFGLGSQSSAKLPLKTWDHELFGCPHLEAQSTDRTDVLVRSTKELEQFPMVFLNQGSLSELGCLYRSPIPISKNTRVSTP